MPKVVVAKYTSGKPYKWPHHTNSLLLDRKDSEGSEIFVTYIQPGEGCHRHSHLDNEQVYYVISGQGQIICKEPTEPAEKKTPLEAGDVVFIPRHTEHEVFCVGMQTLTYVCVDVFPHGKPADEPTWEIHAKALEKDTCQKT
jgi:mannose-6-phosphate isomerase-like protein (cupin superfamily)